MLMHPQADEFARIVVEEGVQVVTTGAGNPGKYMKEWKAAGIKDVYKRQEQGGAHGTFALHGAHKAGQAEGRAQDGAAGGALPSRVVTNEDLSRMVEASDEWITTRTGIRQRYFCAEGEADHTLALSLIHI